MASIRWGLGTGAELCLPFTGNATLSGCRVVGAGGADDDIALAWNEADVDANTVGLWRMNEAAWNGTAGEVVDAGSAGRHGTATGATTAAGWLDRYGDITRNGYIAFPSAAPPAPNITMDGWFYVPSTMPHAAYLWDWDTQNYMRLLVSGATRLLRLRLYGSQFTDVLFAPDAWHHLAGVATAGGDGRFYIDGVEVTARTVGTTVIDRGLSVGCDYDFNGSFGELYVDEFRISDVVRYTSTFSPARYKSAAQNFGTQPHVQASNAGLTGMVPSAVSWSATTGAAYGQVKRVWVNDLSAGWVQVGGDYPTSPVSVSGLVLPSADAVRVELEPEQVSGIQNETPVLDWVQLEYTVPSTGGRVYRPTPMRLGPKLLPMGVL